MVLTFLQDKMIQGSAEFFNNYLTYAARTARHYDAQYSCIAVVELE